MDFYSTYYKKRTNYDQIQVLKDKFQSLDVNGDNALNKNELANIFTGQNLTQQEKEFLLQGVDGNDDNFITYLEFSPAFIEFDVDQNAEISGDEFDLVKDRLDELEKQLAINDQYQILNDLDATQEQKEQAKHNIKVYNAERNIIYDEMNVQRKSILISDKEVTIQEIQDFIDNNTLLEYEEAKKYKEIEELSVEKNILLKKKAIAQRKLELDQTKLEIINKEFALENAADPNVAEELQKDLDVLSYEKMSNENELNLAERELDIHHKNVRIEEKENLLTKFFVPEIVKDQTRKDLDKLRDERLLLNHRVDLFDKVSTLSEIRADLIEKIYEYNHTQDTQQQQQLLQEIQQLEEQRDLLQLQATIVSKQVELVDKQIQLKEVIPKSNHKPFDEVRANLEAEISALEQEIADLQSQLP